MICSTHRVFNQTPPLVNYSLFSTDLALGEALERDGAGWARGRLQEFGRVAGTEEVIRWGFDANEYPPVLRTHDRSGNRRDEVEFHPAWHELMRLSIEHELHSLPWTEAHPGSHVARAALMSLAAQNEAGHTCPVSMTYSSIPVLRLAPELAKEWEPRIVPNEYDPGFRPAAEKRAVLIGMAMTEKQGGSDLRANVTEAQPLSGDEYAITGHKWFCSAPMCDAFLTLAQAPGGLACFLLPRWKPDGERNGFLIQRLKSKMGNRSNASGEVELDGAWARRIGEEGRGVRTIIEMVHHTRLDCSISSAALMRRALVEAIHHARHRSAFGKPLIEQPLMRNVLADLAVESEASTMLVMRLARAFDARQEFPREHAFARLAAAVVKYWLCKRGPVAVGEALECLGGNGYVEESILARLYREAPVNSVWEGAGNVICLDVLRAMRKEPEAVDAMLGVIRKARGADRRLDDAIAALEAELARPVAEEGARRLTELLAVTLQGSLVTRYAPPAIAEAYLATRVGGDWGRVFGTLPAGLDVAGILDRTWPQ